MEEIKTDVLVIGAGGAGALAALEAARAGVDVALASKYPLGRSGATSMTLPVGGMRMLDPETRMYDTIRAGDFINDQVLVATFADGAVDLVEYFEKLGMQFEPQRTRSARFRYGQNLRQLRRHMDRLGVCIIEDTVITKLLTVEGAIAGAVGLAACSGDLVAIRAKAVVLATGGYGRVFTAYGPASVDATGDGVYMAYQAGAELMDLEFVQFHPGTVIYPKSLQGQNIPPGFVLPHGARYRNGHGEIFIDNPNPTRAELSFAIATEIARGNGTAHGGVYLDCSEIPREVIEGIKYFDFARKKAGIDLVRDAIEVCPAAHYTMGGIRIDSGGQTAVPGLFASGEVTGGVHGSNRLGGNALPDVFAFGRIAGSAAAAYATEKPAAQIPGQAEVDQEIRRIVTFLGKTGTGGYRPHELQAELQQTMGNLVGVIRERGGLEHALEVIERIRGDMLPQLRLATGTRAYNNDWMAVLELVSMLGVAELVTRAALMRTESRGAHYRSDHPQQDDEHWLKNILIRKRSSGGPVLMTMPANIDKLEPTDGEAFRSAAY